MLLPVLKNQKGAVPVLLIVAVIGVLGIMAIANLAPFKNSFLASLYPKDKSFASLSGPISPPPCSISAPCPSPSPQNQYLVLDTFTDTPNKLLENHIADSGASWIKSGYGGAKINAFNRLTPNMNNGAFYYSSAQPASAEYTIYADMYISSLKGEAGLLARKDPASDKMYVAHYQAGSKKWAILRRVDGVYYSLGTKYETLTPGQTYAVKFEVKNASKKLYVKRPRETDYSLLITSRDNTIPDAGRPGVELNPETTPNDTTAVQLDNFKVE
jgi:hypothetical protein